MPRVFAYLSFICLTIISAKASADVLIRCGDDTARLAVKTKAELDVTLTPRARIYILNTDRSDDASINAKKFDTVIDILSNKIIFIQHRAKPAERVVLHSADEAAIRIAESLRAHRLNTQTAPPTKPPQAPRFGVSLAGSLYRLRNFSASQYSISPALQFTHRFVHAQAWTRFALGDAWGLAASTGTIFVDQWDVGLSLGIRRSGRYPITAGITAGAARLRARTSDATPQSDRTWAALAGVYTRLGRRLGDRLQIFVGGELGLLSRQVEIRIAGVDVARVGRSFLKLELGVEVAL